MGSLKVVTSYKRFNAAFKLPRIFIRSQVDVFVLDASPKPNLWSEIPEPLLEKSGANDPSRTDDLFITNELLYQLSYIGL